MRYVVFAGTPGSGKTSVLINLIQTIKERGASPAVVKVDCLWTEDDKRIARLGVPVKTALSKDMCPDHFAIYNIEEMFSWAKGTGADTLLNETAGLCLRCAPYTDRCLAVCVIDVTSGPNNPLKVGPLLTAADVVMMTKGDIVSQAEREVFRERVLEANPGCRAIDANGLTGKGSAELADILMSARPVDQEMTLRNNPPFSICTLCAGESRVGKQHHHGLLRRIDGFTEYRGE
ncbi:MAG: GTP-binding protein [Methanomassiliicoccus sp.]|nr:GTP-binding protein [Methanomassiliicoccus sp.]